MRVLFRFSVIALCCIALQTSLYQPLLAQRSETALIGSVEVRPDSVDFKRFPAPRDVVSFGAGVWGLYKGTVNTFVTPDRPASSPTASFSNGISLDIRPMIDYGITLYAPMLFGEKLGLNLDIGLSSYNYGIQYYTNFIFSDDANKYYEDQIILKQSDLPSSGAERNLYVENAKFPKFFTTLQYLTFSPLLNVGGLLLGANIGIPIAAGSITTPTVPALKLSSSTLAIDASLLQLLIEPRIGLQIPIIPSRFGTLFLNANVSANMEFLGSMLSPAAARITDNFMRQALDKIDLGTGLSDSNSRYRFTFTKRDTNKLTLAVRNQVIEPYKVLPISASVGLSFLISIGNNNDQVDEIFREERRSDSLRLVNSDVTRRMDSLRQRSIGLADRAITTIIQSSKISDRIAELEKTQLEKQKTALKTELTDTKKKVFQALFSAVTGTNDDGTETAENPTLRIEQFQAKTTKTLLPKVFFDQGSALLSTRYKRIQAAERESYKLPQDPFQSAYALYPNILNIVGKRLQTSSAKLTLTGFQTSDETDVKLAEKRVESVATYLQDVWKIPASRITRTVSKGVGTSADERRVEIASESADITAPLAMDYTTRLASPSVLNIGLDISTGSGLKQWELEIQQMVNNQGVVLKDTTGGATNPSRFVWRLNEEPSTMPQSGEPLSMRIGAYDINNVAAPDAPLKTVKVEQITLEQKRANKANTKFIQQFELLFGTNLTELDASSRRTLDAAKAAITPQSKVLVTVFGGNAGVSAKGVAQALSLDARSAILRDAGTVPNSSLLPEVAAYNRIIRIRVETPSGM